MVWANPRLLIAVSMTLAAGCADRSAPAPIYLGHVATLSGPDKQSGESAARGIRLAVEEINKSIDKGVGRPFAVIHSNTNGSLEAFEAEAVRLVSINRVSFLLGGTTAEEVERLDRAHVPVLTPFGAHTRTMSDEVFCTGLSPEQRGKVLARFAALELGVQSLVIIQDEKCGEYLSIADAVAREFAAVWAKKDAEVKPRVRRIRLTKDLKDVQEQIKIEGKEALVFAGQLADLRELGSLGLPVLAAADPGAAAHLTGPNASVKELYYVTAFVSEADVPEAAEFANRFEQAFHDKADVHAALAYEGTKLLNEALIRAKDSLTLTKVRDELAGLREVPGLTGLLSFTPQRQLRRPAFVVRVEDGKVKTVKRYNADD
jgi:branched-chain amino acid transport system substrate-binding protein